MLIGSEICPSQSRYRRHNLNTYRVIRGLYSAKVFDGRPVNCCGFAARPRNRSKMVFWLITQPTLYKTRNAVGKVPAVMGKIQMGHWAGKENALITVELWTEGEGPKFSWVLSSPFPDRQESRRGASESGQTAAQKMRFLISIWSPESGPRTRRPRARAADPPQWASENVFSGWATEI